MAQATSARVEVGTSGAHLARVVTEMAAVTSPLVATQRLPVAAVAMAIAAATAAAEAASTDAVMVAAVVPLQGQTQGQA